MCCSKISYSFLDIYNYQTNGTICLVIIELLPRNGKSLDKLNQLESQSAPLLSSVGFRRSVLIINHHSVCSSQREPGTIKHSLRAYCCTTREATSVLNIPSRVIIQVKTLSLYFYDRIDDVSTRTYCSIK